MTDAFLVMTADDFKAAVRKLGGVAKAARSLHVSRSTVYRWMKTGIQAGNGNQTRH